MALLLKKLYSGTNWVFNDLRDPRTDGYFLMDSVAYPFAVVALYLLLVKTVLPQYMEKRKPYSLKYTLLVYNAIQIVLNGYVAFHYLKHIRSYDFFCMPLEYTTTAMHLEFINVGYIYYLLKYVDLIDTIFFILKKNYHQVTFLHVYHHSGMVFAAWLGMRFMATGHTSWCVAVNSTVHVLMFSYYLLTTLNDKWKKNLTLKKSITQIQLVQFCFLMVTYALAARPSCKYPNVTILFAVGNAAMFTMFMDFYRRAYINEKQVKNAVKSKSDYPRFTEMKKNL